MILYIKRLTGTAKSPVYGTKDSAGMDLHADETITIQPAAQIDTPEPKGRGRKAKRR